MIIIFNFKDLVELHNAQYLSQMSTRIAQDDWDVSFDQSFMHLTKKLQPLRVEVLGGG